MAPTVTSPFEASITELVRYKCSCGCLKPISKLYFCRHCLDVRCGFCVSHEVDSHYCPNCMENMPRWVPKLTIADIDIIHLTWLQC